jgi:hypothetical protein
MSHFATDPDRAPSPNHRAQVLAEAVVSAYIDEIARSGRRQHRAASAPSRRGTVDENRGRSRAAASPESTRLPAPLGKQVPVHSARVRQGSRLRGIHHVGH